VIMYQLLTGKVPVGQYPAASSLVKGVPRNIDPIIQRCLRPREERYATASALLEDLQSVKNRGMRVWFDGLFGA
jgi:hypothetical protein